MCTIVSQRSRFQLTPPPVYTYQQGYLRDKLKHVSKMRASYAECAPRSHACHIAAEPPQLPQASEAPQDKARTRTRTRAARAHKHAHGACHARARTRTNTRARTASLSLSLS